MNKGKKDLEKVSESLGSLIERAKAGEEVSEEEARKVLGGVAEAFKAFFDAIEPDLIAGQKKLDEAKPEGVVVIDPRLWLKHHNPDLLNDPQVSLLLGMIDSDIDKRVKKTQRKSTRKMYHFEATLPEKYFIRELVDAAIEYLYSNFHINIAKSMYKEYFEYSMRSEYALNTQEMVVLRKAIVEYLEQLTDTYLYKPKEQTEGLKNITEFLEKEMRVEKTTTWAGVTEDGVLGEWHREKGEEMVKFIETYNEKEATELLIKLAEFAKGIGAVEK